MTLLTGNNRKQQIILL